MAEWYSFSCPGGPCRFINRCPGLLPEKLPVSGSIQAAQPVGMAPHLAAAALQTADAAQLRLVGLRNRLAGRAQGAAIPDLANPPLGNRVGLFHLAVTVTATHGALQSESRFARILSRIPINHNKLCFKEIVTQYIVPDPSRQPFNKGCQTLDVKRISPIEPARHALTASRSRTHQGAMPLPMPWASYASVPWQKRRAGGVSRRPRGATRGSLAARLNPSSMCRRSGTR